ncbi:MAG: hypothetical protein RL077_5682 [Verrucomicrobiota bacterium]
MNASRILFSLLTASPLAFGANAPRAEIPAVLSSLSYGPDGKLFLEKNGQRLPELEKKDAGSLPQLLGEPTGNEIGVALDFKQPDLNGSIAFGPYPEDAEFPTVAFLAKSTKLTEGRAQLDFKATFTGPNDFFKLKETGRGIIGYRVINAEGRILYEGRIAFEGKGPYRVLPTIIEGPFVNEVAPTGCVISFETQVPLVASVTVDGKTFRDASAATHHEITLDGLKPATTYPYAIRYGDREARRSFKTAPAPGSRQPFTFAFASANRATTGGGERDFGGTNYSSTRAVMAAAVLRGAVFMQASGDMTNGANSTTGGHLLEYANWKRALDPFWCSIPVYVGFGDHEINAMTFAVDTVTNRSPKMTRFPYVTESGEATFAQAFVHPKNGPASEDGAGYDPDATRTDFPTYQENVYAYTYDNVAMIVLNTEYWKGQDPKMSGCPEGYIMDQQFAWLQATIKKFEADPAIDHLFVNVHSAVFPNGDHANGAMWYDGNNTARAKVKGAPVGVGILERRDQILDLCVNRSRKFVAFLSGDEHNFACLAVTPDLPLYLDGYTGSKVKLNRTVYHINNGGGGSAAYAMLPTPWTAHWKYFTEPPTVALIKVDGASVTLTAFRAETFGKICTDVKLR